MAMHLIQGTFHVRGYSPDGDSVKFKAKDAGLWSRLGGERVRRSFWSGHVQLRVEAVDALETHFQELHQPRRWADAATDHLLSVLGIEGVKWDSGRSKVEAAQDGVPGYILCRETDKYGRPVAFVFAGQPQEADGSAIHVTPERLKESLNFKMMEAGLVYPIFYKGLFSDLRQTLSEALKAARKAKKGLWADDTTAAFEVKSLASLQADVVILPKLFRRLATYLQGASDLSGFKAYLASQKEAVLILSRGHFTHLDHVLEVEGKTVKMLYPPEDLVFLP